MNIRFVVISHCCVLNKLLRMKHVRKLLLFFFFCFYVVHIGLFFSPVESGFLKRDFFGVQMATPRPRLHIGA